MAGAEIILLAQGASGPRHVTSDAGGLWSFDRVPAGNYLVGASAEDHMPSSLLRLPVASDDQRDVTLRLATGGEAITFRVVDALGGVIDGALLRVRGVGTRSTAAAFVTTDEDGVRAIRLARGHYRVEASHERYAPHETSVVVDSSGRTIEIALSPASSIAGVVRVRESSASLANAVVMYRQVREAGAPPTRSPGGDMLAGQIQAAPDGTFTIPGLRPGRFELMARDATHVTTRAVEIHLELGEQRDDVLLEVDDSVLVRGTVVDDRSGDGVADARIFAQTAGAPQYVATSGADGRFEAGGVLPGQVILLANHDGAISDLGGVPLDVSSGASPVDGVVIRLQMGVMVSGRVEPAQQASIEIAAAGTDYASLSAGRTTEADGTFTLGPLRPGDLRLVARTTSGLRGERDVSAGDEGSNEIVITLGEAAAIDGHVIDDRGNAIVGARIVAEPLEADQIEVDGRLLGSESATSGDEGSFAINGMAGGRYLLVVTNSRGESLRPAGASVDSGVRGTEITLAEGAQQSVQLTVQASDGRIAGTVVDSNGQPVADVWVSAQAIDNDLRLSSTRVSNTSRMQPSADQRVLTDADGNFEIVELARQFRYRVDAWDQRGETAATARDIDADDTSVRMKLQPFARLTGRVVSDGQPVQGIDVVASRGSTTERATTDATGAFEIDALRAGRYSIRVQSGDLGAAVQLALAEGETADQQLELVPRPHARGVVQSGGKPVIGADISIVEPSSTGYLEFGRMSSEQRHMTDAEGRFDVPVDVGEWTLVVSREPHQATPGTVTFTVAAGDQTDLGVIEYAAQ